MHKDRLLKLADLLEADAANPNGAKFDLRVWAMYDNYNNDEFPSKRAFKGLNCNTAACAIGLACLSGAFKDEGLTWKPDRNNITPLYDGLSEWYAVRAFFGIDHDSAINLFSSLRYERGEYAGAKAERAVAKRIRKLVAAEEASAR